MLISENKFFGFKTIKFKSFSLVDLDLAVRERYSYLPLGTVKNILIFELNMC